MDRTVRILDLRRDDISRSYLRPRRSYSSPSSHSGTRNASGMMGRSVPSSYGRMGTPRSFPPPPADVVVVGRCPRWWDENGPISTSSSPSSPPSPCCGRRRRRSRRRARTSTDRTGRARPRPRRRRRRCRRSSIVDRRSSIVAAFLPSLLLRATTPS